jgi:carbamoyltransferase
MSLDYSIGLGKTIFNSGAAIIPWQNPRDAEVVLTERFNRIKNSGAWPLTPLSLLQPQYFHKKIGVLECRDVQTPLEFEVYYNSRFPFLERLKLLGLESFSSLENEIEVIPHHLAHAWSALAFSPFTECLVLVLDGAGNAEESPAEIKQYEYLSLFRWKDQKLELLDKKFLSFIPSKIQGQNFSEGIGIFYEKTSEFIFNNKTEAGKVMGLAPFGESAGIQASYTQYLESLDWKKQYQGKSKKEWEESPHRKDYQNLAATVQENFEHFVFEYLKTMRSLYPDEMNIIFTGGCALNCTFNGKLAQEKMFQKIFIPPNPGDEGISLGCAYAHYIGNNPGTWEPTPWDRLTSYRGLKASVPKDSEITEVFKDFEIIKRPDYLTYLAELLNRGEVIAFMQARSEIGPRALGNRSILASPKKENLKNYLNENVKFREDFRPYGCTVQWEKAHYFFEVEEGFENPFMSFAVKVRDRYKEVLKDLSHIDGTSRMQTLHFEQNDVFHKLLEEVEKLTGLPILLNTSLNVMNEPIVENIQDAKRFFDESCLKTMVIGNYIIQK